MFAHCAVFRYVTTDHDWDRLVRYVTGECEPAEARETLRWINADAERSRVFAELSALHRVGGTLPRRWDVDAAWRQVAPGPRVRPFRTEIADRRRRAPHFALRTSPWLSRIAAVLMLASSGVLGWKLVIARRAEPRAESVAMEEIATRRGQLMRLRLSDGTRVTLGAQSRLRYPRDFGARRRDLWLDGQALFAVTHDATKPLRVRTGRGVVDDIGTQFVVKSYAGDSVVRVAVTEGVVALRSVATAPTSDSLILKRGDAGTATGTGRLNAARNTDLSADTAWTSGRLVFQDTALRDAIPELARWYDLDIHLTTPALGARLLTASFADVPVDAVLSDLARALKLRYTRDGRSVRLSAR